ncbi:MAG: ATP phosphoribosyltransferase [Kiritimatiellia bacterium]
MKPIMLGLPKGSLQEATFELMRKAGFAVTARARSYVPDIDDPEIEGRLIRAQEISRYVELGVLDAGITGYDWIVENSSDVKEVSELVYSKQGFASVKWVVAVPERSSIKSVRGLEGKRVATEAVGITKKLLKSKGVKAQIEFSWGATEAKVPELADAIVELTETGSSLRANKLRVIATVLESTTRLIANKASWRDKKKRAKIEQIAILIEGALAAQGKVLLKMNVRSTKLPAVSAILPSLHAPTISNLNSNGWAAIETVVPEATVREIIPRLKKAGAEGIVELSLNKIIA